ncbi:MAG: SDR family oxidoreductase [Alphaproteobacteria bacterium]|nr:SDR family oxidoreductase [Alphaproteobacteria bacterium]
MSGAKGLVLVTGAAKRIGRAIALEMAKAGWDVVVHCHTSLAEAEETAKAIQDMGRKAHIVQTDLADSRAVNGLIPSIPAEFGPLTALINNASLFECDENDPGGARHQAVNFEAPRLLSEQFLAQLPPGTTGAIVNLLDATPIPETFGAYLASKEGLRKATLDMARSMAPRARVNAVAPGPTMRNPRETRAHFERLAAATPLGLEIPPQAVAATILFLIENPFITGEILHVDGGAHLSLAKL